MKSTLQLQVLVLEFCLFSGIVSMAQPVITGSIDIGNNNASDSYFIKSNALGQYRFGKNTTEAGFLMNLKKSGQHFFPGYRVMFARDLSYNKLSFCIQAFLVQTCYGDLLRETNWGIGVSKDLEHIRYVLGAYSKIYAFRKKAIEIYKIEKGSEKMKEPSNLLYSFTYFVKPITNAWNMGLTVTNFDYFLYYQQSNPILNLNGCYKLNENLTLFAQVWFEPSGVFNINACYFGYYFRTGLKLKII